MEKQKAFLEFLMAFRSQVFAAINKQLSLRRARVVRDKLVGQRIDPTRLSVASRSDYEPRWSNETEEGRAGNRRTEIFFFDPHEGDLSTQYGIAIEVHAQ